MFASPRNFFSVNIIKSMNFNYFIKDTHREKRTVKKDSSAYKKYKYGHLGRWYIKSTSYKRLLNWNKIFKKNK